MNQGSITKDPVRGTWQFVIDAPTPSQQRRQIRRRGFPTKRDAINALNELRKQEQLLATDNLNLTYGTYLTEIWLPQRTATLRPTTTYGYTKTINNTLIPTLGHLHLHNINRRTLEHLYAQLLTTGGQNNKGLSRKTISNLHGLISKSLDDAVRWDYLNANPASGAQLPKAPRPEMTAWTAEQATQFLNTQQDNPRHAIWRLALTTGLRRGELCGLQWKHINFDNNTIAINQTRVVAHKAILSSPKTQAGNRILHIDNDTSQALQQLKQHNDNRHQQLGDTPTQDDYIIEDDLGTPPHPETVTRWWNTDLATTNLPKIRLHDARHTAATLLFQAGIPHKVITQRLGHSDITTTMRLYQHTTTEDDQNAASALAKALK